MIRYEGIVTFIEKIRPPLLNYQWGIFKNLWMRRPYPNEDKRRSSDNGVAGEYLQRYKKYRILHNPFKETVIKIPLWVNEKKIINYSWLKYTQLQTMVLLFQNNSLMLRNKQWWWLAYFQTLNWRTSKCVTLSASYFVDFETKHGESWSHRELTLPNLPKSNLVTASLNKPQMNKNRFPD
jgi:hypothetical protein